MPPICRREAMGLLGAGTLAAARALAETEQTLHFTTLDHVEISVPDPAASAAFYAKVFGGPVWKHNQTARRYVMFGPCYIAIEQDPGPSRVEHFSAGIENFQIDAVHAFLRDRGIAFKDYPSGRDVGVTDPDGIQLELSADGTWNQLKGRSAFPEPLVEGGTPLFQPTGIEHILLNVSDVEKSAAFYEKIFGPVAQRNNKRIFFRAGKSRIGLVEARARQRLGVNHFCVSAVSVDYAADTKKLEDLHAQLEKPEVAGSPEFLDSDGVQVQVMGPR